MKFIIEHLSKSFEKKEVHQKSENLQAENITGRPGCRRPINETEDLLMRKCLRCGTEMKKILSVFLLSFMVFTLSACNADVLKIEDYEWKMRTVASNDIEAAQTPDELIVAVGEADELHPDAEIVDLTLTAKGGEITITDTTNDRTYTGTYEVMQKTPKGTDYEIIIDGVNGYATVAPTEYYDGSEIPTLPININGYSLYFIPNES